MAYAISDLSHIKRDYVDELGNGTYINVRTAINALVNTKTGFAVNTTAATNVAKFAGQPRHIWIENTYTASSIVHKVRRKVYYNSTNTIETLASADFDTLDGLTGWKIRGHVGEKTRA